MKNITRALRAWLGKLLANLLGGRPMRRDCYAFTDCSSEQEYFHWTDRLGRQWVAAGAWSIVRTPVGRKSEAPAGSHSAGVSQ